jgi:hypothetical protein
MGGVDLAALIDRLLSRPLTRLLLRTPAARLIPRFSAWRRDSSGRQGLQPSRTGDGLLACC